MSLYDVLIHYMVRAKCPLEHLHLLGVEDLLVLLSKPRLSSGTSIVGQGSLKTLFLSWHHKDLPGFHITVSNVTKCLRFHIWHVRVFL